MVIEQHTLSRMIKSKANQLGFDLCRIMPVEQAPHADFFEQWIMAGNAGEMHYLAKNQEKRRWPTLLATDDVTYHSMIVLAVNHYQFELLANLRDDPSRGIIASYAWGDDYHEIIRPLLYELDAFICQQTERNTQGKCLVDTGPVLERDWAQRSGIGFTGKNCCTINPQMGSWLLLATILVPEILTYDDPLSDTGIDEPAAIDVLQGLPPEHHYGQWSIPAEEEEEHNPGTCGRCTRCLDACPTDAFIGPYHLNPQRCISYWTIESRQPIPRELRSRFHNRIFGCDICQEVCPWNHRLAQRTPLQVGLQAQSERVAIPLLEGFHEGNPYWLNQEAFSQRFRRSPIKRAKRAGMLRNVCVALGNWGSLATIPSLAQVLNDPESLARGHAAWALGQVYHKHGGPQIIDFLQQRLVVEDDSRVSDEIRIVLQ